MERRDLILKKGCVMVAWEPNYLYLRKQGRANWNDINKVMHLDPEKNKLIIYKDVLDEFDIGFEIIANQKEGDEVESE